MSNVELDDMEEVGYYIIGPFLMPSSDRVYWIPTYNTKNDGLKTVIFNKIVVIFTKNVDYYRRSNVTKVSTLVDASLS